jgi:hypothetical protein
VYEKVALSPRAIKAEKVAKKLSAKKTFERELFKFFLSAYSFFTLTFQRQLFLPF